MSGRSKDFVAIWTPVDYLRSGMMYVGMYGHTYIKSMYQLGKVANPARGHLNRED